MATRHRFRDDRPVQVILGLFAAVWLWSGVNPHDLTTWVLENVVTAVFLGLLVGTYGRFRFSPTSYALMAVFLSLHVYGSHYTYSHSPVGEWARDVFSLDRNHYDRVVHFLFGFMFTQPTAELLRHRTKMRDRSAWRGAPLFLLAVSSLYELLESWAARVFAPEAGESFVAMQGDMWDAQKDMTLATVGSILWLVGRWVAGRARKPAGS